MKRSVTIVGGTWSPLARCWRAIDGQVNVVDSQNELAKHRLPHGVGAYALGAGATVMSIAQSLNSTSLEAYVAACGNSSADDGADASRVVGDALAQYEIELGAFSEFVATRRNLLIIEAGGNLDRVEHATLAGSWGGMGGGAARRLDHAIALQWVHGGYGIHRHFIRLGPKSHTRTSEATDVNERVAAAAYCEDLFHYMEAPLISAFETRELTYVDLPLSDADERARACFAATCGQALLCNALRSRLMAYKVNGKNKLKRVTIAQVSWYGSIEAPEIHSAAYDAYFHQLNELLEVKAHAGGFTVALRVDRRTSPINGFSVAELVERITAGEMGTEEFLVAAESSEFRIWAQILASTPRGSVDLCQLEEFLNQFGPSLSEFLERRLCVGALLAATRSSFHEWKKTRAALAARLAIHKKAVQFALNWSFGRGGILSRVVSAAQLLSNKKRRLTKRLKAMRSTAAEFAYADAAVKQLMAAIERLAEETGRIELVVRRIRDCLTPFRPQRRAPNPLVEMQPMEDAWPTLIAMDEEAYADNGNRLCELVRFVTSHGLQKLVGASDHSVESILESLKVATPSLEGPHWGGETSRRYDSTVFVLPPVRESLRLGFEAKGRRDVDVLFADGAAAGVTVVRMRLCTPRDVAKHGLLEIFTRSIRERFEETILPENRADFYPTGSDAWLWLKAKLTEDRAASGKPGSPPATAAPQANGHYPPTTFQHGGDR